ncbi:hypothetical protein BY458DRAFT_512682 [Sporodiniella umbellata]|nr:hypothetical protein BY458DRAFT_512682 [Sporodiniella umbellata]
MRFFKLTKLYQKNKQPKPSTAKEPSPESTCTEESPSSGNRVVVPLKSKTYLCLDNKERKSRGGSSSSLSTNGQSRKSFSFKHYIPSISSKKEEAVSPAMTQDSDVSDSEEDDEEIGPPLAPTSHPTTPDSKVIERMKERHRSQVRLAALRRQHGHSSWLQDHYSSSTSLPRTPHYHPSEPMAGSMPKLDEPSFYDRPYASPYYQQQLYQHYYYHQQLYQYEQMKLMQQHYMASLAKKSS